MVRAQLVLQCLLPHMFMMINENSCNIWNSVSLWSIKKLWFCQSEIPISAYNPKQFYCTNMFYMLKVYFKKFIFWKSIYQMCNFLKVYFSKKNSFKVFFSVVKAHLRNTHIPKMHFLDIVNCILWVLGQTFGLGGVNWPQTFLTQSISRDISSILPLQVSIFLLF